MSTQNQCFKSKKKEKMYTPVNYIKVGCKGVFVTRTCFHDVTYWDYEMTA